MNVWYSMTETVTVQRKRSKPRRIESVPQPQTAETVTVTSKHMVTIPAAMMRQLKIKEGDKLSVVVQDTGLFIFPKKRLIDYYGVDEAHAEEIGRWIKELDEEHRREARET